MLIEVVAYLPQKMLSGTQIACALVVLSRGSKTIRMVDASEIYHSGRRSNYLAEGVI
jgi:type I restriction enzyme M protein